jgi:hypothetical protein
MLDGKPTQGSNIPQHCTYIPNRLDVVWEATRAQGLMNEGHVVAYLAEDISEKFQTFNYAGKAHQL